jgi:nicotinamide mononucleotide transporter
VLGFIGWWQWVRGGPQRTALEPTQATPALLAGCVAFVVVGTAGLTVLLTAVDDAAPFWDALTTAISLAAQFLLNAKKIESWWFWIAADVIYVPFYLVKRLDLTAIVYVLFLGLCVLGLRQWRRTLVPA